jgi:hypothetical protein
MQHRFKKACYALAATAAVTTTLGLAATGAASASTVKHSMKPNATSSCGATCFNLYNKAYGPNQIQSVWHGTLSSGVGSKLFLGQASNANMGEDFTAQVIGPVTVLCGNWPAPGSLAPNSYACLNYSYPLYEYQVVQSQYQPLGYPTNLCVGVARQPYQREQVTLRNCGGPKSMWVADTENFSLYFNPPLPPAGPYVPWINAADTPSSGPMVLTAAYNRRAPHDVLTVQRERIFSGGTVDDSQEFGVWFGTAP